MSFWSSDSKYMKIILSVQQDNFTSLEIYAAAFQRKGSPLRNVVMTIDGTKHCFCRY